MTTTTTAPAAGETAATPKTEVLLGNEAIGWALVKAGVQCVAAYPGTPSSEILPAVQKWADRFDLPVRAEWEVNEKVAAETAIGACLAGKRTAAIMKQVGLNVAADPITSLAYTGVPAGFILVVADDPGQHSSQTEQDTRYFARFAKMIVFDPTSPADAVEVVQAAMEYSEKYELPVILRPVTRLSHGKQPVVVDPGAVAPPKKARFKKDAKRWVGLPSNRAKLLHKLNRTLDDIAAEVWTDKRLVEETEVPGAKKAIIASGVCYATVKDLLKEAGVEVPILRLGVANPLSVKNVNAFVAKYDETLILEDSTTAIEDQITNRDRETLRGRLDDFVPREGELYPHVVRPILAKFLGLDSGDNGQAKWTALNDAIDAMDIPVRKPVLCPGCGHRVQYHEIYQRFKARGIYSSDIGCYTLGVNQKAIDTVYDMGGSIPIAAGFALAYAQDDPTKMPPIVASIGDSTFWHSGLTGLASAVWNGARFMLVIMDNSITAMTGGQPVPHHGALASGEQPKQFADIEEACKGLGARFVRVVDPYDHDVANQTLEDAWEFVQDVEKGGVAVVISRRPCMLRFRAQMADFKDNVVTVSDECNACGVCQHLFGCPALVLPEGADKAHIDESLCVNCGACVEMCPKGAIKLEKKVGDLA
jgi:indolepyruvate ferredoxin oxidoreductase alpha subunit